MRLCAFILIALLGSQLCFADIYDDFSAFASLSFGAEKDSLIYERFGNSLQVSDYYEYVSESSASIGFESSLPAASFIEYGPTSAYGLSTEPTDRKYYQHLHRLVGLQPGTAYNYRVVLQDERGNTIRGENRVITPTEKAATRIPQDMQGPPYVLSSPGTYLLTQDIVADWRAFEITSDNVVLDLGGNTVTYNNAYQDFSSTQWTQYREHAAFGITSSGTGTRVFNGRIRQGAGGNAAHSSASIGFNPIYLRSADNAEIAGVEVEYHGAQMVGMYLHWGGPATVHHNVFVDRGSAITDRHGTGSRSVMSHTNDRIMHNNLVKRTRQNGLHGTKVFDNEIYIDSHSTNSFGVTGSDSQEVYLNRIFGTGYHVVGIGRGNSNHYHHNFIHLVGQGPQPRWPEYGTMEVLSGFRLTQYSGGTMNRSNNLYHDNLIIAQGGACAGSECTVVRGIQHSSDIHIVNNVIRNNIIKVDMDDGITQAAAIVTHGLRDRCPNEAPVYYIGNTLISNAVNVRMGDSYAAGCNHRFINNTFIKIGNRQDYQTFAFDVTWNVINHFVIDGTYSGGASQDSLSFRASGQEFSVGWTITVRVTDSTAPVPGAAVTMLDRNGRQVAQGTTDAQGMFSHPVVEYVQKSSGREYQGPIEVSVTYQGNSHTETVSVDSAKTLNIDLSDLSPQPDTSPPSRTNPFPSGQIPAGTVSATISLTTNEPATCRYSATPGMVYDTMTTTFASTGTTSHSQEITGLENGVSYTYYVRCMDSAGNANTDDFIISFSVASAAACSPADTSGDGIVSITELRAYIGHWKAGSVQMPELMTAIREWKEGC